jgi:hypothetical protein
MKLRLKKDIIIKAGTVFDDAVAHTTERNASQFVVHTLGFGKNASGDLHVGHEVGDEGFDKWFEPVEEKPKRTRSRR